MFDILSIKTHNRILAIFLVTHPLSMANSVSILHVTCELSPDSEKLILTLVLSPALSLSLFCILSSSDILMFLC